MSFPQNCLLLVAAATPSLFAVAHGESSGSVPEVRSSFLAAASSGAEVKAGSSVVVKPGLAGGGAAVASKGRSISLRMAEGLRFDPPRFEAKPGETLLIKVENVDPSHLAHNFVIVKPGHIQEVVQLAMGMGEDGPAKAFVPTHPSIIAASSKVVDPEKKLQVQVKLPDEPGVYGYVCTVPGHGMIMYGAIYVGLPMPSLAKDTNIPQLNLEKGLAGGGRRPFVQRMFLPNAGPAAIAVALKGNQNFCFDAGSCHVRYIWQGPFLDAGAHWRGNGNALGELGEVPWWNAEEFPLRIGDSKKEEFKVNFMGYSLLDGIPEFHFRLGKQEVFETITADEKGLEFHFRLPGIDQKVTFLSGAGSFKWSSTAGEFNKGMLEVEPGKAIDFSVRLEARATTGEPTKAASGGADGVDHAHKTTVTP